MIIFQIGGSQIISHPMLFSHVWEQENWHFSKASFLFQKQKKLIMILWCTGFSWNAMTVKSFIFKSHPLYNMFQNLSLPISRTWT